MLICLGGGVPHLRSGGVPHPRSHPISRGVPHPRSRGYPISGLGGVPHLRSGQTCDGVPPAPHQTWDGIPPPPTIQTWTGYPPEMLTDRHLWKQYLPVILRMRAVITHSVPNYCPHPKDGGRYCFQFVSSHLDGGGGTPSQVWIGGGG